MDDNTMGFFGGLWTSYDYQRLETFDEVARKEKLSFSSRKNLCPTTRHE